MTACRCAARASSPSGPTTARRTYVLANRVHQTYPAVRLDDPDAMLYVRDYEDGEDTLIPRRPGVSRARQATAASAQQRARLHEGRLRARQGLQPGTTARPARSVVGAGLLALREAASFLR